MKAVFFYVITLAAAVFAMVFFQIPSYVSGGVLFLIYIVSFILYFYFANSDHELSELLGFSSKKKKSDKFRDKS